MYNNAYVSLCQACYLNFIKFLNSMNVAWEYYNILPFLFSTGNKFQIKNFQECQVWRKGMNFPYIMHVVELNTD